MAADEWDEDEANGKSSIAAQAEANGHVDEDDDAELFPAGSLEGDNLTVAKVVKGRIEVKAALSRAEVPVSGGGLFDPNRVGRALVTFLPGKFTPSPLRDAEDKVDSWKVTQELRVTHVRHANEPQDLIRDEFADLSATDEKAAGALLDELNATFAEAARAD